MVSLQNVATGLLGTVFALYVRAAGMSTSVVGDVEGALALASAIVCLLLPPLVSAVGYRWLLVGAGFAFAASRLGQISGGGAAAIIALGLLLGVGDGIGRSVGVAFLSESQGDAADRTMLFTIDFAMRVMAAVVGAILGGVVPTMLHGVTGEVDALRWTIGLAVVLYVASALPVFGVEEAPRSKSGTWTSYVASVRGFRSWGRLARLSLPQLPVSFGAGLIMPFVPLFLRAHLHASVTQIGFIMGLTSVVMAAATLATPLLARRVGLVGTVVLTQLASLPFLLVIPLAGVLPVVAVAMWMRTALMNMSWPIYNQMATDGVDSADKPLVLGWMSVSWGMAWLGGSVVGGRLAESTFTAGYFVTAALYAAGAILTWVLMRVLETGAAPTAENLAAEAAEPQA